MKILIDNGHGMETPGKRSPDASLGLSGSPYCYYEWKWTREVARGIVSVLLFEGYDAELLVPEDNDISLQERVRRVNAWCKKLGKDNVLLVSIHSNASGHGREWMKARGWTIYTTKGITKSDYLAEEIYKVAVDEFKAPLKVRSKGPEPLEHDNEENFYIIYHSWCPACLIENFFHDNKEDVAYLKSDLGHGQCIHVAVQGIENYIASFTK